MLTSAYLKPERPPIVTNAAADYCEEQDIIDRDAEIDREVTAGNRIVVLIVCAAFVLVGVAVYCLGAYIANGL